MSPALPCDEQGVRCHVTIKKGREAAMGAEDEDRDFKDLLARKVNAAIGANANASHRGALHIVFTEAEKKSTVRNLVTFASSSRVLLLRNNEQEELAFEVTFKRAEHPLRVRMSACARERDLRGYVHAANLFGAFRDNDYVLYVQRAFPDMSAFDIVHAFSVSGSSLPFLLIPEDEADQLPTWKKRVESALAQLRAPLTKSVSDISPFLAEFGKRAERPALQLQRELARQSQPRTAFGRKEATAWPEGRVLCVLAAPYGDDGDGPPAASDDPGLCEEHFGRGEVPPDDVLERLSVRRSCAADAAARGGEFLHSTYIPKHCLPVPRLIATPDACVRERESVADGLSFSADACATLEIKMHSHSQRSDENGDPERNLFVRMARMQAWLQGVLHGNGCTRSDRGGAGSVGPVDAYYMIVGYRKGPLRTGRLHIASPSDLVLELQAWITALLKPPSTGGDTASSEKMLRAYTASAKWEPEMNVDTTRDGSVHSDAVGNLKKAMLRKHKVTSLDPFRSRGDASLDMFAPFTTKEGVTQIVFHASDSVPILCDLDRQRRHLRGVSTAVSEEAQCYLNTVALACDPVSRASLNNSVAWMLDTPRDGRDTHTSTATRSVVHRDGVGDGSGSGSGSGSGALSRKHTIHRIQNFENLATSAPRAVAASAPPTAATAYDAYRYSLGL